MKTNLYVYAGLAGGALVILWLVFGWPSAKTRPVTEETASLSSPAVAEAETSEPADSAYRRLQKQRTQGSAFPEYFVNGRPATPEEVAQIKAQDKRVAEERRRQTEEAAYWETRQEWIENFPFEPTPHPEITYDPEVLEEKRLELDEEGWPIVELDEEGWPIIEPIEDRRREQMLTLLERNRFLCYFYNESPQRYSPGFEQMHGILAESSLEEDPVIWGRVFTHLVQYHRAAMHDPNKPFPVKQVGRTWGEEKEDTWNSMIGWLTWRRGLDGSGKHETLLSEEEAIAVRERLINELPAELFIDQPIIVGHHKYDDMLKPGDLLLIR
ncbi:MAG: hypothetical protein M2R46_00196 [Verrucomicrobia subdivision 3 bacterium]|nr:hypothetical protein [Limisphaerales bacterium]